MRVLVTGAAGFLGSAVVDHALQHGHEVTALVRPTTDLSTVGWRSDQVRVVRADLRGHLEPGIFDDVDAVIHAAAATTGDLATQLAGSVVGTERLLNHLDLSQLHRFVHVSSFSVYDFAGARAHDRISSTTPLEPRPDQRDAYTTAKLAQERLVRSRCAEAGTPLVVLRPGVIFGEGKTWDWGGVLQLRGIDLVFAPRAQFRLTHVDNCAEAVVLAIDAPDAAGRTLDVVDDDLPTHAGFRRMARLHGAALGRWWVPVPWSVINATGLLVDRANRSFADHRAKLPEFVAWRRQQARWKPFTYSNADAKRVLGWTPALDIDDAVSLLTGAAGSRGGGDGIERRRDRT